MPAKKTGRVQQPPLPPAGQKRRHEGADTFTSALDVNRGASVASSYGIRASSAASSVDYRVSGGISRRRRGEGGEVGYTNTHSVSSEPTIFSPTTNTAAHYNGSLSLLDEFASPNNNNNINTNIMSTAAGAGGRGGRGGRAGARGNNPSSNVKKATLANAPPLDYSSLTPRYDTTVYEAPVTTPGPTSLSLAQTTVAAGANPSNKNKKERAVLITSSILPSCLPSPLPFLRRMVDIRFLDKLFVTPPTARGGGGGGRGQPAMKEVKSSSSSAAGAVKESLRILTNDDDDDDYDENEAENEEGKVDSDDVHQRQQRTHLGEKRAREEVRSHAARRGPPSTLPSPAAAVQALQSGLTFGSYCVALASVVTAAEVHSNHLQSLALSLKGQQEGSHFASTNNESDCSYSAPLLAEELADLLKACEEAYRLAMLPLSDACEGRGGGGGGKGGVVIVRQNHNADLLSGATSSSPSSLAEVFVLPSSSPRSSSSFLLFANVLLAMEKLHQVDLLIRNCGNSAASRSKIKQRQSEDGRQEREEEGEKEGKRRVTTSVHIDDRDGGDLFLPPTTELFRLPSAHGVNNAAARNFIKARAAKLNLLYRSSEKLQQQKQQEQSRFHTNHSECLTISLQEREGVAVVLTNTTEGMPEKAAFEISTTRGDDSGSTFTSLWEVAWRLWPAANISVSAIDSHWLVSDRARYVRNNQDIVLATSPAAAASARHTSSMKHLSAAHHLSILGISTASAAEVLTRIRGELAHDLPLRVAGSNDVHGVPTRCTTTCRKAVRLPIQATALISSYYCPQQQHQHEFFIPPKANGGSEEDGFVRLGGNADERAPQHLPTPPEPSIAVETQANLEYSHRATILQNDVYRSLLSDTKLSVVAVEKTVGPDEEGNNSKTGDNSASTVKSATMTNGNRQQTSTIELPIAVTYSNSFSSIRNCAVAAHGPTYELLAKLFANYEQSKCSEHLLFSLSPANDKRRPMPASTKRKLAVFADRLINNYAANANVMHTTSIPKGRNSGTSSTTLLCGPPSLLALSTDDRLVLETKTAITNNSASGGGTSSNNSMSLPTILIDSYVDNGRREVIRNILAEVEAEDGLPRYMRYVNRIQQEDRGKKHHYHHHSDQVSIDDCAALSLLGGVISSVEGVFPTPLDLPPSYFPLLKHPHLLFGGDAAKAATATTAGSPTSTSSAWANYEQGIQQEIIDIFTDRIWGLGSRNGAAEDDSHRHHRQQHIHIGMTRMGGSGRPPPRLIYPVLITAPTVAAMRLLMQLTLTRSDAEDVRKDKGDEVKAGGAQTLLDAICCFLKDKAVDLGLFGKARSTSPSGSSSSPFGSFAAEALLASTYQPPSSSPHPSGFHLVVDLDSALVALLGEGTGLSPYQDAAAASPLEEARVRVHEHVYASSHSFSSSTAVGSSNLLSSNDKKKGREYNLFHRLIDTPTVTSYGFIVFFHSFTDTKHLVFHVAAAIEM